MGQDKSDQEELLKLFDKMGVSYEIEDSQGLPQNFGYRGKYIEYDFVIRITEGIGYSGFYSELYFRHGKYKGNGSWE